MLFWRKILGYIFFVVLLNGCGYTLSHRLKDTFTNSKGIFVPVFNNGTDELGVEMVFTNALIRELSLHGEVLLNSKDSSGLELRGNVDKITYTPAAMFSPAISNGLQSYSFIPDQISVTIGISFNLIDHTTQKSLWTKSVTSSRNVSAFLDRTRDIEGVSSFGMITQSLIESRYNDIARELMREVYDDMVELF